MGRVTGVVVCVALTLGACGGRDASSPRPPPAGWLSTLDDWARIESESCPDLWGERASAEYLVDVSAQFGNGKSEATMRQFEAAVEARLDEADCR